MASLPARSQNRSRYATRPEAQKVTKKETQYVVMRQEVTLFTILTRLWWFTISLAPAAALVLITYSLWAMMDHVKTIANAPFLKLPPT
jgi:hypothetical protein